MFRLIIAPVCHRPHFPLRLHHILVAAVIFFTADQAESGKQLYLVCQDTNASTYYAVSIDPNLDQKANASCGISDLKSVEPLLRFVKVKTFHDDTPKEVYYKQSDVTVIDGTAKLSKDDVRWRGPAARARRHRTSGHVGGQTKLQHLSKDRDSGEDAGKAAAHSDTSSRPSVGGRGGISEAQSQTTNEPGCDECHGRSGSKSSRAPAQGGTGTQFGSGSHESNQGGSGMGYRRHLGRSGALTPGEGRQGGNGNGVNGSDIQGSGTNGSLDGRGGNTYGIHGQANGDESGVNGSSHGQR